MTVLSKFKTALLASAASSLALTLASMASAQEVTKVASAEVTGDAATGTGIQEIIVTARRVDENVQRVPIAETVVTGAAAKALDITDIYSVTKITPGYVAWGVPGSSTYPLIRGIESGAVSYFGEAPRDLGGYSSFFDMSNLQVLKGPQGTLFGLAANAGALVITPTKPGTTFGGYMEASGGTYDRKSLEGAVDLPLANDKVLFRLAVQDMHRDGYITDIANNTSVAGEQDYYIIRPSLTIKPTDNIESYTLFDYFKSNVPIGFNNEAVVPYDQNFAPSSVFPVLGSEATLNGGSRAIYDGLRAQVLLQQEALGFYKTNGTAARCAAPGSPITPIINPPSLTGPDRSCPGGYDEKFFVENATSWKFAGDFSIKNIFGYSFGSHFSNGSTGDDFLNDGGLNDPKNQTPTKYDNIFSDEIQLHGKLFDRLDFVSGIFHNEDHNNPLLTYAISSLTGVETATKSRTSTQDWSAYTQGNYDLSDFVKGLTFTAGYRYSMDRVAQESFSYNPTTLVLTNMTGGPSSPAGLANFKQGSYTIQLQYQYNPATLFYINNSKGYSSGGLQNVAGFPSYSPDSLNNIEVGTKTTFAVTDDLHIRTNDSVYYGFYQNIKVPVYVATINALTGQQGASSVTLNAGEGFIYGFDGEFTATYKDIFDLGGGAAYTKTGYTKFPSLNPLTLQPVNLTSQGFIDVPLWQYDIHATYHAPIKRDLGALSFSVSWSWSSENVNIPLPQTPEIAGEPQTGFICTRQRTIANNYPAAIADGKTVYVDCAPPEEDLDFTATWDNFLGHQGLMASVGVTNITQDTFARLVSTENSLGYANALVLPPRMFVAKMRYRF